MLIELIITLAVLIIYLIVDSKSPIISNVFVFLVFLFALANTPERSLSSFYLFGILFVMIVSFTKMKWRPQVSGEDKRSKFMLPVVGIAIGIGIFIFMRLLQSRSTASIIGVPSLSVSTQIGKYAAPALIGILGIVENRVFFSIYELLKMSKMWFTIPILIFLGPVVPTLLTAIGFAIFHISAYNLALSSMIFAAMVFALWLIVYEWRDDDVAPNIAHYLWNSIIKLSQTLKVI